MVHPLAHPELQRDGGPEEGPPVLSHNLELLRRGPEHVDLVQRAPRVPAALLAEPNLRHRVDIYI